ncbi:MAG TPA: hypothetical protein VIC04_10130 [Terriglobia bacterium]|jgi:hypothetical protein
MDDQVPALREKLERLMRETAEVVVALNRADGTVRGVPHYSVIEMRAHELGCRLSRSIQERQMTEVVSEQTVRGKCPECGTACDLGPSRREVSSIDGKLPLQELKGHCPRCRRDFFPSAGNVGLRRAGTDADVESQDRGRGG